MEDRPGTDLTAKEPCVSCGAKLKGDYCRKCGEKKIIPERDFRVGKFLRQQLWHIVHFDSKLLRSYWLLYAKPGYLVCEWIAGRRVIYMKPIQMFIVAGLLFYFFLPKVTAYYSSVEFLILGYQQENIIMNTFHFDIENSLTEKSIVYGVDEINLTNSIEEKAARQSKTWLFMLIPFWGTLIYLFFQNKIPWLAPHLIFAMNGLTFYLLTDLLIHALLNIFGIPRIGIYILFALLGLFFFHQILAVRSVYANSWLVTILKTTGIMVGFIIILFLYKQVMTIGTLISF